MEIVVMAIGITLWIANLCFAQETQTAPAIGELAQIGNVGPQAIPLKVWTNHPPGAPLKPGDSVEVHLQVGKKAYLTALFLSGGGNTIVLFPNAQLPETVLLPDKEYILFGEDSGVKLTVDPQMQAGEMVFYVSSTPVVFNDLKPEPGKVCTIIPPASTDKRELLRSKLEAMAKDEGFNRTTLSLRVAKGTETSLRTMGLPTAIKSEAPTSLTGVQGIKPKEVPSGGTSDR